MEALPWLSTIGSILIGFIIGSIGPIVTELISRQLFGPQLDVEFEDSSCVFRTPVNNADQIDTYFRLRIINRKRRALKCCRAWLTEVEFLDRADFFGRADFADTFPLIWSYDEKAEALDLPYDVPRYVDVAKATLGVPNLHPQFHGGGFPLRYQHIFSDFGVWNLTILVSGEDVPPKRVKLMIRHKENELEVENFQVSNW